MFENNKVRTQNGPQRPMSKKWGLSMQKRGLNNNIVEEALGHAKVGKLQPISVQVQCAKCTSAALAGKSHFSAQLEVTTFKYQVSTLTSAAIRKYLPPLALEACTFARSFAHLSRKITHVSDLRSTAEERTHTHTHTHTHTRTHTHTHLEH